MKRFGRTVVCWLCLVLAGCGGGAQRSAPTAAGRRVALQYATGFAIELRADCKIVTVRNAWKGNAERRYVVVKRGAAAPTDVGEAAVVETPLERCAAESTTHLSLLDRLGVLDRLAGFPDRKTVCNPTVRERMETGAIVALGTSRAATAERLAGLKARAMFVSDFEGEAAASDETFARLGVAVVRTAEFAEEHPLGRLEWIKFFAAFFDEDEKAALKFAAQAEAYERLAAELRSVEKKPTVMVNAPYRGVWHVPGGKTYLARLIADAGGRYLWADVDSTASLPLQFEAVLAKAADADVWLHPGLWKSRAEAVAEDDRNRHFRPWKEGRLFNNNLRVSPDGALAYWEEGLARPEELLRDLAVVFHPERSGKAELLWHRKLP
jgi:iron complex transport system substrate-binding protein